MFLSKCLLSFFFQAEDGIRVRDVTGVQTCALPIWVHFVDGDPGELQAADDAPPESGAVVRGAGRAFPVSGCFDEDEGRGRGASGRECGVQDAFGDVAEAGAAVGHGPPGWLRWDGFDVGARCAVVRSE